MLASFLGLPLGWGYLDIYNKDGCQNQLQWDLVTLQHETDAMTFLGGSTILCWVSTLKVLSRTRIGEIQTILTGCKSFDEELVLHSTENPEISHWSHSYLNYLPYSQWTAHAQSAPKRLSEEEYKWKVMENLQPCVNSLQAPSFYGIRYEKVDGTADGYFFFGKKALAFKTQEELLRPCTW